MISLKKYEGQELMGRAGAVCILPENTLLDEEELHIFTNKEKEKRQSLPTHEWRKTGKKILRGGLKSAFGKLAAMIEGEQVWFLFHFTDVIQDENFKAFYARDPNWYNEYTASFVVAGADGGQKWEAKQIRFLANEIEERRRKALEKPIKVE